MNNNRLYDYYPIIYDIVERYKALRTDGNDRKTALDIIYSENKRELQDEDDCFNVIIGIAIALCRKNELTIEVMDKAHLLIRKKLLELEDVDTDTIRKSIESLQNQISMEKLGDEAKYPRRRSYNPEWSLGDTFIHQLKHPAAKEAHIQGWYVVFRKIGEYIDSKKHNIQLVYVTLCPPNKIPKTDDELNQLGVLRMMKHDTSWDYCAHIEFRSQKDEEQWELTKIGCFPLIRIPGDATIENPCYTMPLFGKLTNRDVLLDYEEFVSRMIRFNGIGE